MFEEGTIIGNYRIEHLLGAGMAEVYLATHVLLNRKCALKIMKRDVYSENPVWAKRFVREAQLVLKINHPNVVKVFDAGCDKGTGLPFIAMEFVEGTNLADFSRKYVVPESMLLHIAQETVKALKAINDVGIVHRDIKPANIMICKDGTIKLMDLGIAKISHQEGAKTDTTLTTEQAFLGTPAYASPEQCRSVHNVDIRSDIYSLGASLYYIAAGRAPYDGTTSIEILCKVLESTPKPLASIRFDLSQFTISLIEQMMEKNPEKRPQTPDALIALIERRKYRKIRIITKVAIVALVLAIVSLTAAGVLRLSSFDIKMLTSRSVREIEKQPQEDNPEIEKELEYETEEADDNSNTEETVKIKKETHENGSPYYPEFESNFNVKLSKGNDIKMIWCTPGRFEMGSSDDEPFRNEDEEQHLVEFSKGFWLGAFEITHGQWKEIMGTDISAQFKKSMSFENIYKLLDKKVKRNDSDEKTLDAYPELRLLGLPNELAMHFVSYNDCLKFCHKLNVREKKARRLPYGYHYSLPTEAQWEYACRAGTQTALYNGNVQKQAKDDVAELDEIAWYGGNSSKERQIVNKTGKTDDSEYTGYTACVRNVGGKKPNAWGFYDMIGNVSEWCLDWYGANYNGDEIDPQGVANGLSRVIRGGNWYSDIKFCRAAGRARNSPEVRSDSIGFRLALVPVNEEE